VCHKSAPFFDEKDDQRRWWYLRIISQRDLLSLLTNGGEKVFLFVHLQQPDNSVFAATYFIVVSDEKEDQPRQLISEEETCSPRFLDSCDNDIAESFTIGSLEEVKKLSKVSVRCIIEYQTFDLKESDNSNKQVESPIIDDDKHLTGWIQQDLETLLKNQSRSDICFIIEGHELRAHKVLLSARSPVFTAIINKAEAEDDLTSRVEIKNMLFTTFKALIHFIYTDHVVLTESNAEMLLAAAQEYSIPLLIKKCEQFLQSG